MGTLAGARKLQVERAQAQSTRGQLAGMRPARKIRLNRGWSMMRVAGVAGVTLDQVKALETGDAWLMSVEKVIRIAAALGCSAVDLMPGLRREGLAGWDHITRVADAMEAPIEHGQQHGQRFVGRATRQAMDFLRRELAAGPRKVAELQAAWIATGGTYGPLRRALKRLDVHRIVNGFGQPQLYQLPDDGQGEADPVADDPAERFQETT